MRGGTPRRGESVTRRRLWAQVSRGGGSLVSEMASIRLTRCLLAVIADTSDADAAVLDALAAAAADHAQVTRQLPGRCYLSPAIAGGSVQQLTERARRWLASRRHAVEVVDW